MDVSEVIGQSFFAYALMIVVATAAAFMIRGIVFMLEHIQHRGAKQAEVPLKVEVAEAPPPVDETANHVAVVAAAVYHVIGAHRLVHIGEAAPGGAAWRTTGRVLHHMGHAPKRSTED